MERTRRLLKMAKKPRPPARTALAWIAGAGGLFYVLMHGSSLDQALACVGFAFLIADVLGELGDGID